eukprot:14938081-Ditylum_brightwellii.AAC.1
MEKASDQPRHAMDEGCVFYSTHVEYNNQISMSVTMDSSTDEAAIENIHKVLLDSIGLHITKLIKFGSYGAVHTDDLKADCLYIVKFIKLSCTLQYDVVVNDKAIVAGSLACSAHYTSPAQKKFS